MLVFFANLWASWLCRGPVGHVMGRVAVWASRPSVVGGRPEAAGVCCRDRTNPG